jgi:hypothetical protein
MITTLGIDTGDTAGFGLAGWEDGEREASWKHAYQCDGASAPGLVRMILHAYAGEITAVQIERFIDPPGRNHGLAGTNPAWIRVQVADLAWLCEQDGVPCFLVTASEMKNWAMTGDRLKRAGLAGVVAAASMKHHAADGMGHALMCAVKHCGLPDPASRAVRA